MKRFDDKKKIKKLAGVFRKNNVTFAYLFGSRATGNAIESSDFDFAVMFSEKTSSAGRFAARCKIISELANILGNEKVEVVALNDAKSILFKFIIIKDGILIYESNGLNRVLFELKTTNEYYDFSPFIEKYNEAYLERESIKIVKK